MYYLKIYVLKNCGYCSLALKILKSNMNKKVKLEVININDKDKNKYKTKEISTFPQIYLKKNNSKGSVLLGGYTDIKNIINKINFDLDDSFKFIKKSNNNLSKKAVLRIIEIFS